MPRRKFVYAFGAGLAEGDGSMKELLGGKGAGLHEMTKNWTSSSRRLHYHHRSM